ncbi:MAG: CRISPR-associated helicase Cas3' [Spirochaetota bacterium]
MVYYAHSIVKKPEDEWHLLSSHLQKTAEIAGSFAHSDEYAKVFKIAGLLHDLGKYQESFQNYLREGGKRGSVPHASWGAAYSLLLKNQEAAFAIDGHHKGLPDLATAQDDLKPFLRDDNPEFNRVIKVFQENNNITEDNLRISLPSFNDVFEREMFIRYMFSSLTDADWLDTEKACNPELSLKRENRVLDYDELINKINNYIQSKPNKGELNSLRNKTREFALSRASESNGFFSLNLPTGMGKTLTSVLWALEHAKANHLKRIIIVLPFINIIDQTAEVLKNIFGEEFILEHHSGIGDDILLTDDENSNEYNKRLACENWDYPIIITTTVQFFESIFSNKPSKCRKIHNIAESVVIFDEVQSLPKDIIIPTLTMLKNILTVMRTSFLFCTATLPAFEKREAFNGIESITPLTDNPDILFKKVIRVTYFSVNNYEPVDFAEIKCLAEKQHASVLSVFNTKKKALEFYKYVLESTSFENLYHLSTGMCPAHRKRVINSIRDDLQNKKTILVSSTQLIEAGVDFDFPCVFREIAPLESIIQSAGRCNREGLLKSGKVFLFCHVDPSMPDKQYRTASDFALELIKENPENFYNYNFYHEYYKRLVGLFVDGDARKINELRSSFKFQTINDAYRIIDKKTKSVVIYNYSDESKCLVDEILRKQFLSRDDYRRMQKFVVQVYANFILRNKDLINVTKHGVLIWYGGYDDNYGISHDASHSDDFVV